MSPRPRFRIVAGRPVAPLDVARKRHGKAFAADKGSNWKPSFFTSLTRWLLERKGAA